MSRRATIRFCNNPVCERCDEHLRPRDLLRKAGRDVCPSCLEVLVIRDARPKPPRIIGAGGRPRPRRRHEEEARHATP